MQIRCRFNLSDENENKLFKHVYYILHKITKTLSDCFEEKTIYIYNWKKIQLEIPGTYRTQTERSTTKPQKLY